MSFKEEINLESLINALLRMVIEFLILFVIYFWLLGTNTNLQNSWLFFTVSFVLMVTIIPVQVQFELILKYAFNWKKCFEAEKAHKVMIECKEATSSPALLSNLWESAFKLAFPGVLVGTVSLVIYHYFFQHVIWLEIVIIGFVSLAFIFPLVLLLNKRYLFPACLFISSEQHKSPREYLAVDDYFFYHHILPWLPITLLTSGLLTYKMTAETLFAKATLDVFTIAMYATSTSYATLLWTWHASKGQAKVELKMKLFDNEKVDKITSNDFYFLIHCIAVCVLLLTIAIGYVFFDDGFPQLFAIICIVSFAVLSGALGNILGVVSVDTDTEMPDEL